MYVPSKEILDKYADLMINFALGNGKGIKKGDVVLLRVPEVAKPFLISLRRAVLKAGGHTMIFFYPDEMAREFYELANEEQLSFFPDKYCKGLIDQADHSVYIIADKDKKELEGINSEKIMKRNSAYRQYKVWQDEKEDRDKFSWTLCAYATEDMAREAGMSLEEYWGEIIQACYLDKKNPTEEWKKMWAEIEAVKNKLNELKIQKVRVESEGTDLIVGIGKNRKWLGATGQNIPSYECFISPDCRMTEGHIKFNEPLYRYGTMVKGISLKFEKGKVVEAKAEENEEVLKDMIAVEGANMIGEFSLTDSKLSRVRKFMAETLFDENKGGKFGNTHIALGNAYHDTYPGKASEVSDEKWKEMGYNSSIVHTDIVSTENRKVIAYLENGSEKVIYKDGKFTI
jgi:aminopeptidase